MKDYKKILEGVVNIIDTTEKSDIGFANICTYIGENCPELKESEDEKIRKKLIEAVKGDMVVGGAKDKQRAIAWLEKQGEPNPYRGVSFKYNGHTWGMCARDNGVEILVDGEIKERVFLCNKPQGKSALESINEEKVDNANKVEPKFKDGDWITNGNYTWQVISVDYLDNGISVKVVLDRKGSGQYAKYICED
jgi:hypothetical protein